MVPPVTKSCSTHALTFPSWASSNSHPGPSLRTVFPDPVQVAVAVLNDAGLLVVVSLVVDTLVANPISFNTWLKVVFLPITL